MTVKNPKRLKIVIAAVAVALIVGGGAYYMLSPEEIETAKVSRQDINATVTGPGNVAADDVITVYAPVAGRINAANYSDGDHVSEGDELISYDLTLFQSNYDKADAAARYSSDSYDAVVAENKKSQSQLATAKSQASDYEAQYSSVQGDINSMNATQAERNQYVSSSMQGIESAIANMQADLTIATGTDETIRSQALSVEAEIASLEGQQSNLDVVLAALSTSYEALEDSDPEKASIKQDIDAKLAEKEVLGTQIKSLKDERDNLYGALDDKDYQINNLTNRIKESQDAMASLPVNGMTQAEYQRYASLSSQLDMIERKWNEAISQKQVASEKVLNESAIKAYADSVEVAEIDKSQAENELNLAQDGIKAACTGIIVSKLVSDGATVEAGQELYTLQPLSGYKVDLMVSKYDVGSIEIGQKASITVGSALYEGEVTKIHPIAEEDASAKPKVKVEISIADAQDMPTLGLEADVTIHCSSKSQVLSIPASSLYTDDQGQFVYVLEGTKPAKKYITTGIKDSVYCEVLEGLAENDTIITAAFTDANLTTSYLAK